MQKSLSWYKNIHNELDRLIKVHKGIPLCYVKICTAIDSIPVDVSVAHLQSPTLWRVLLARKEISMLEDAIHLVHILGAVIDQHQLNVVFFIGRTQGSIGSSNRCLEFLVCFLWQNVLDWYYLKFILAVASIFPVVVWFLDVCLNFLFDSLAKFCRRQRKLKSLICMLLVWREPMFRQSKHVKICSKVF